MRESIPGFGNAAVEVTEMGAGRGVRRGRRGQDPQIRRAQLMDAARHCFAEFGFEATTVDRIARRAGVSVGLLYRFYDSKAAFIEAIVVEDTEAQFRALAEAIDADSLGATGAARLVQNAFEAAVRNPDRIVLMFEMAAAIHRNSGLRDFLRQRRATLRESLVDRLVAKGLDVEAATAMLARLDTASAIASGVAMQAIVNGDAALEQSLRDISPLIETMLAPDRPGAD